MKVRGTRPSSARFFLSVSNREFNLGADPAHAVAADLGSHRGRITFHNYTAIMRPIKSALFSKKKKKKKVEMRSGREGWKQEQLRRL